MQKIILLGGELNGTVMDIAHATPKLRVPSAKPGVSSDPVYPGNPFAPAEEKRTLLDYDLCGLESPTGAKIYQLQGMTSEAVVACLILAIETKDQQVEEAQVALRNTVASSGIH